MSNIKNNMHWRAGYVAYDNGAERWACNHNPESIEYSYWQEGFTDAERDDKWLAASEDY